jgi:hypothetical protein
MTPALAYDVTPVSGGGIIKGKVTFNGAVPTRTILPTKDAEICGGVRKEPVVRVGPDKGVQDAVVALQGIAKGKAWLAAAQSATLDQQGCIFLPQVQVIPAGKLVVANSDPVLHNTHGFYGKRTAFNLALPNKVQKVDVELTRPGAVRIECDSHGWMLAWVHVVDNPYYALTDANGGFEITDVPPGKYTLTANQEHTGPISMEVEVTSGQAVELPIELKK